MPDPAAPDPATPDPATYGDGMAAIGAAGASPFTPCSILAPLPRPGVPETFMLATLAWQGC